MVSIAYGSIAQAPTAPIDTLQRDGLQLTWTGWDGSVWPMDRNSGSGVYLLAGARGLHMPPGTRFRDTSPAAHGSQHRATLWHERPVYWPLKMWHGGTGPEFMERDRAFWRTLDPDQPGTWSVTQSSGETRTLELRLDPDQTGDPGFDTLPSIRKFVNYQIYLTADQPFYTGSPSVRSWGSPNYVGPFFEENGPHLFNIGQGISLATAAISNLGDVDSPPVWYLDGDVLAGAYVGVGTRRITIPFSIPAGRCLVIDSDPTRIGATQYTITAAGKDVKPSERIVGVHLINPVDRSAELGPSDFAPIPPGASVSLSVNLEGSGKVEVAVPSLYKRAW